MKELDLITFAIASALMLIGLGTVAAIGLYFVGGYWKP